MRTKLLTATAAVLLCTGLAAPTFAQSSLSQGAGTQSPTAAESRGQTMMSAYDEQYRTFRDEQAQRMDSEYRMFVERQREQHGDDYASSPEYQASYNAWQRYQMRRMGRDYQAWMSGYSDQVTANQPMGPVVVTFGPESRKERCLDEVAMLMDEAAPVTGALEVSAAAENAARMCESGQIADAQGEINQGYRALHEVQSQGEPSGQ